MGRAPSPTSTAARVLGGGTLLALLALPYFAADPERWSVFVGVALAATLGLLVLWRENPFTTGQILLGAFVLRLAFLPLLPGLTDDLYRYIWDGWLQVQGINPYHYVPEAEVLSSFQSSLIYDRLNSQSYYSVYPPLSQLVFAVGGWFYPIDWTASYYVLKGIFAAAEFGGVLLLSRLTSSRNLLLYAWNPLVLVETAGQGHTEALLIPLLLGAVWAVRRDAPRWASLAVAGAGLVKLYPFFLWPFLGRRYGWPSLWPGGLLVAGLSLPYAAPYTLPHIKESVDLFSQLFEFNAGPYYLTKYVMRLLTGADWSKVLGPIFRYTFLALLGLFYVLDGRRHWTFRRACLLAIGTFLFLSTTVHPWYLLPVLALGVLSRRPAWPWFWVATFSVGTYLFYVDGPYWTWIILGWGGGTVLGLWHYRRALSTVWSVLLRGTRGLAGQARRVSPW